MAEDCGTCHAPVHWAWTPKGQRTPVDYAPDAEKGNTLLLRPSPLGGKLLAVVLSGDMLQETRRESGHLFVNHWATCRDRVEWRQRTDAKKADRHDFQAAPNPRNKDCVRCGLPRDDPRHRLEKES